VGIGEPLANYKRVVAAVRRITDPAPGGLVIGQRSVTVSRVGLAPAIRTLADEKMQVPLHTPDDELRDTLAPVNECWSVDEVLSAARYYADTSGRRVSIEYALIRDINDQPWRAELLAKRLRKHLGQLVHVDVIPAEPDPGSKGDALPKAVVREFVRLVNVGGVACTGPRYPRPGDRRGLWSARRRRLRFRLRLGPHELNKSAAEGPADLCHAAGHQGRWPDATQQRPLAKVAVADDTRDLQTDQRAQHPVLESIGRSFRAADEHQVKADILGLWEELA
jgi:hypothetical protein